MIYWISGAYGVGKSTIAAYLAQKLCKTHVFDAEEVGNAVRDNYPEEAKHSVIFEDYPIWRKTVFELLLDIAKKYDGDILVPMTLLKEESYLEIIKKLQEEGVPVKYVFLDGDYQTIHDRILSRGESENCWCMQSIKLCLEAQKSELHAIHVNTVGKTPAEIAEEIIEVR